jgi:hypothetical protein
MWLGVLWGRLQPAAMPRKAKASPTAISSHLRQTL